MKVGVDLEPGTVARKVSSTTDGLPLVIKKDQVRDFDHTKMHPEPRTDIVSHGKPRAKGDAVHAYGLVQKQSLCSLESLVMTSGKAG